jgi:uncharacterized protein YjaZ
MKRIIVCAGEIQDTVGEAMISEGMASLYEEEHSGETPTYATTTISSDDIARAKMLINDTTYDHSEWFFGSKAVSRWFGYTYGYQLCKDYAEKHHTTAREMVNVSASTILKG